MESKHILILGSICVTLFFGGISFEMYSNNIEKIEMARHGLEQCPKGGPDSISSQTIWVKDCNSYMKNF